MRFQRSLPTAVRSHSRGMASSGRMSIFTSSASISRCRTERQSSLRTSSISARSSRPTAGVSRWRANAPAGVARYGSQMLDGTGAVRITDTAGRLQGTPRWSPDGRWIAYDVLEQSGEYGIYVLDAAGGSPRSLTARGSVSELVAGRQVDLLQVEPQRVRLAVWRIPTLAGGTPQPVTDTGAHAVWESWDGALLVLQPGRRAVLRER